jgi:hypothetical protein
MLFESFNLLKESDDTWQNQLELCSKVVFEGAMEK